MSMPVVSSFEVSILKFALNSEIPAPTALKKDKSPLGLSLFTPFVHYLSNNG
jgi:hypothetical protein